MVAFNKKYVTDKAGQPVAVLLDLEDFRRMVDDLEELDAIRAYDLAKASGDEAIPFSQAVSEVKRSRS